MHKDRLADHEPARDGEEREMHVQQWLRNRNSARIGCCRALFPQTPTTDHRTHVYRFRTNARSFLSVRLSSFSVCQQ